MEDKDKNLNIDDKFLKKLIQENVSKEDAPKDFTKKTMDLVMQEWIANPIETKTKNHGIKYWIILISLLSVAGFAYIATDARKLITMSDIEWLKSFDKEYLIYLHSAFHSITESFLQISPIVYIVLAGIVAITITDKLLKRSHYITNLFMV